MKMERRMEFFSNTCMVNGDGDGVWCDGRRWQVAGVAGRLADCIGHWIS